MQGTLFPDFPNKLADTSKSLLLVFLLCSQVSLWKRSGDVMNVHEVTQELDGKFWPLRSYFCLQINIIFWGFSQQFIFS